MQETNSQVSVPECPGTESLWGLVDSPGIHSGAQQASLVPGGQVGEARVTLGPLVVHGGDILGEKPNPQAMPCAVEK